MDYDTKQQPRAKKKPSVTRKATLDIGSDHLMSDTANYCSCLERVQDYSQQRKRIVTYIDVKNEHMPEVLYDTSGLEWQVWRKDYGQVVKYYWYNHLLDKVIKVWDNGVAAPAEGFTRLYRGLPEDSLPQPRLPKKAKSFLKKATPTNHLTKIEATQGATQDAVL